MEDQNLLGSEIRQDYRNGFYSIMTLGRSKRPKGLEEETIETMDISNCPFERANDSMTTDIMRYGGPWQIKVIQNKYPELSGNTPFGETVDKDGLLTHIGGYGYNEVVIESPVHTEIFEAFSPEKLIDWLNVIIDREETLYARPYIKYVQVFKNYGVIGGASLGHPHTQIIAWPVLIGLIKKELDISKSYRQTNGTCLYEKIYDIEKGRVLIDNNSFFAIAPFGSRITAESMIVPKRHVSYAGELSSVEKYDFISILKTVLLTNRKLYGNQAYNFTIHEIKGDPDFHMHLEIYPRLSTMAGIELGENVFVNTVIPEEYAEEFRNSLKNSD